MSNSIFPIVLSINAGIITLITPEGEIKQYRPRGLSKLSKETLYKAMADGFLSKRIWEVPELPEHYTLFEGHVFNSGILKI